MGSINTGTLTERYIWKAKDGRVRDDEVELNDRVAYRMVTWGGVGVGVRVGG